MKFTLETATYLVQIRNQSANFSAAKEYGRLPDRKRKIHIVHDWPSIRTHISSMNKSCSQKKVFLILNRDLTQIQGNTEKYYLSRFLASRSNLHVFAPIEKSVEGAINHPLPLGGIPGVLLLNVFLTPYWLYYFLKERPDIVYCYETIILPAFLGRWVFGAKVAYDLRSDPYDQAQEFSKEDSRGILFRLFLWIGKFLHFAALQWAHYVFVLSEPLATSVISNYRIDPEVVRLLPLGVDIKRFTPIESSFDRLSIVYVGTLNKRRGIGILFEAVCGLSPEKQANLRLDLYGDGRKEYISALVAQSHNETPLEVHWHGIIPHEDIPKQAGKSDIAVSPLLPYEAFQVSSPAKIFEYLAMGLPIVGTRIDPHERILNEGKNALLYEPESADSLREQLESLLENERKSKKLAENARSTALQHSWEQRFSVVETTLDLSEK